MRSVPIGCGALLGLVVGVAVATVRVLATVGLMSQNPNHEAIAADRLEWLVIVAVGTALGAWLGLIVRQPARRPEPGEGESEQARPADRDP